MGKELAGRPSKYREEFNEQAYRLCLLGATDQQLADFFGTKEQTINNWKNKYPSFFDALKAGKAQADANVASSLYSRAMGYEHDEDKIFLGKDNVPVVVPTKKRYPPDPTSMIFWLKNRQPQEWRDRQEVAVTGGLEFSIKKPEGLE